MTTAIVIPVADVSNKSTELLDQLMQSIDSQKIYEEFPVYICYDSCADRFIEYFQLKYPYTIPVINSGNRLNFAANINRGLRIVRDLGYNALAVNQDTILPDLKYLKQISGEGIVSPKQVCIDEDPKDILNKLNKSQESVVRYSNQTKLTGFCMFLSNKVLKQIGLFNESYIATFEDDHICALALIADIPLQEVSIKVHHFISKCESYNLERLGDNTVKFRAIWGIPANITHLKFNEYIKDNYDWNDRFRND